MIYISAQPDSIYFIWQLEIQLRNFRTRGIERQNIHVLIGYDERMGINPRFEECM